MATLASFNPYVVPWASGVAPPTLAQAIRDACIEFCMSTAVYQTRQLIDAVAGTQDYTFSVPTDMRLGAIIDVGYGNRSLEPIPIDDVTLPVAYRGAVGSDTPTQATPVGYFQKLPDAAQLSLYPVPVVALAQGIAVRAYWVPTITAATVPDVLLNKWAQAIGAGATARLMLMPAQPFTNPTLAPVYAGTFQHAIQRAKQEARRGSLRVPLRVAAHKFA